MELTEGTKHTVRTLSLQPPVFGKWYKRPTKQLKKTVESLVQWIKFLYRAYNYKLKANIMVSHS